MKNKIRELIKESPFIFEKDSLNNKQMEKYLDFLLKKSKKIQDIYTNFSLKNHLDKVNNFVPILKSIYEQEKNINNQKYLIDFTKDAYGNFVSEIIVNKNYEDNLEKFIKLENLLPFKKEILLNKYFKEYKKNFLDKQEKDYESLFFDETKLKFLGIFEKTSLNTFDKKNDLFLNLFNLFIKKNKTAILSTSRKISDFLKFTFNKNDLNYNFINELKNVDALFISNIEINSLSKWYVDEIFLNVLFERIENNKLTFLSTNLSIDDFSFIINAYSLDKATILDELAKQKNNIFFEKKRKEIEVKLKKLFFIMK